MSVDETEATESDGGEESVPPVLLALAPQFETDKHQFHVALLASAVDPTESPSVRSIALSGSYGTGKSSVLERVVEDYGGAVLNLSLSSIGTDLTNDQGGLSPENQLQKELLKQILYRRHPSDTPLSRFSRIAAPVKRRNVLLGIATGLLVAIALFETRSLTRVEELGDGRVWASIAIYVVIAILVSSVTSAVLKAGRPRIAVRGLAAGPATLTLGEDSDTFFDRYLDEIIYAFEINEWSLVIIEDLDRFENPEIFESLRDLSSTLNNSAQLGRDIRFIYAIRDSIFEDLADRERSHHQHPSMLRTKFFDVIVPMVPFLSHRSARDVLQQTFADVSPPVPDAVRDLVAQHVADMRLIKNIRNEYVVFAQRLLNAGKTAPALNPEKLFAMVVYKNVHPSDFERVLHGESSLDEVYRASRRLVDEQIAEMSSAEVRARESLAAARDSESVASDAGTRLNEYARRTFGRIEGATFSGEFVVSGETFDANGVQAVTFWRKVAAGSQIEMLATRGAGGSLRLVLQPDEPWSIVSGGREFSRWDDPDAATARNQLKNLRTRKQFVRGASLQDLILRPDIGASTVAEEPPSPDPDGLDLRRLRHPNLAECATGLVQSTLAIDLLRAGHIDRNFTLYGSVYYDDRLGLSAQKFVIANVQPNTIDHYYTFDSKADIESLLREESSTLLRERAAYNVEIFDHLLAANSREVNQLIGLLATWDEDAKEFTSVYLRDGQHPARLVARLTPAVPGILTFINDDRGLTPLDRVRFQSAALLHCSARTEYEWTPELTEWMRANLAKLAEISGGSRRRSTKRSADAARLLVSNGVRVRDLSVLNDGPLRAVATARAYDFTFNNLRALVPTESDLALDRLAHGDPATYRNVLDHLDVYFHIAQRRGKGFAVSATSEFESVAKTVWKQDRDALGALLAATPKTMLVENLEEFDTGTWRLLQRKGRIRPTAKNIHTYLEQEGLDEHLAGRLEARNIIDPLGISEEERARIASAIIRSTAANLSIPRRIRALKSLRLKSLPALESIGRPDLTSALLRAGLVSDTATTLQQLGSADQAARCNYIIESERFADYAEPSLLRPDDVGVVLSTDEASSRTVRVLLERIQAFGEGSSARALGVVARRAASEGFAVSIDDAHFFISSKVGSEDVVGALGARFSAMDRAEILRLLELLGGPYASLRDRGFGRRLKFKDTVAHRALLARLDALDVISSVSFPTGEVQANLKVL